MSALATLHADAVAVRPVRLVGDDLHYYEAATFPANPWGGCERLLRRLRACGMVADDGSGCLLDILCDEDTIVQDYPLTRAGLRYVVRFLKLRRDRQEAA